MADSNTIYNGVKEYFEPKGDSGIRNPKTCNFFGADCHNFWLDEMPWWPELEKTNNGSSSTIAGVIVPYRTGLDRNTWLFDRIKAIDARVEFVRKRTGGLIDTLKGSNADVAVAIEKGFTAALSLLPGIGSIIASAEAGAEANRKLEAYKIQSLAQQYTEDIKQLASIRAQLSAEYVKGGGPEIMPNNAPKPIPTYYYFIGAFILLMLFLYIRNNRRNSR